MNKVDLCAQASAAVAGWISASSEEAEPGHSARVHLALLNVVLESGSTRRQTQALRAGLIRHINAESRAVAKEALAMATKLQEARFGFEATDTSGRESWVVFKGSDVPPVSDAPTVLKLATVLHEGKVRRQPAAMRAFECEAQLGSAEVDLHAAWRGGDSPEWAASSPAIDEHRREIKRELARLRASDRELVLSASNFVSSFTWNRWALPVELAVNAGDLDLREAAAWYERLRGAMYRPLPVDERAPAPLVLQWKRDWEAYEDLGTAFGVIAVWLKCLTSSPGAQRCRVCYRHLRNGMKHFCTKHTRTANKRQDSRDLHMSGLYRPLAERLVRSRSQLQESLSTWPPPAAAVQDMLQHAKQSGISPDLAIQAAALAAELRQLFHSLTPSTTALLQRRFGQLFSIAQAPFEQASARTRQEWEDVTLRRHQARIWLGWETFFKSLFGPASTVAWCTERTIGDGLDPDHPMATQAPVPPHRLARDLMHLSAWLEVDKQFDKFAYIDMGQLNRLRRGAAGEGRPKASLAAMAAAVGASHEAVRQTLRFADGLCERTKRRDRIIPGGIRRLEAFLAQEL